MTIDVFPPSSAAMSLRKLPVVLGPVSVLRQEVSSVDLPTIEAGAVSLPVSTKPTSVAGQFPGPVPEPAADDAVLPAV